MYCTKYIELERLRTIPYKQSTAVLLRSGTTALAAMEAPAATSGWTLTMTTFTIDASTMRRLLPRELL